MRRLVDFVRGIAALLTTLAVLGGLPAGLTALVGWPLPTETPSVELVQRHLDNGDLPDVFVIKVLALIVWLLWAQFALAVLVEARAAITGRVSRHARVLPGVQLLAAKLVTWVTLVSAAVLPARTLTSASLTPIEFTPTLVHAQVDSALDAGDKPSAASHESSHRDSDTAGAPFSYRTGRADSWWSIAESLLGDGMRWDEVRQANLGRTMGDGTTIGATTETVRAGWQLSLPADAKQPLAGAIDPEEGDDSTVIVEPGDHFWGIAESQLSEAWRREPTDSETTPYWVELVAENMDRLLPPGDPDVIYPEQQFVVPAPPVNPDVDVDLNGDRVVTADRSTQADRTPTSNPQPLDAPNTLPTIPEALNGSPPHAATQSPRPPREPSAHDELGGSDFDNVGEVAGALAYVAGAGLLGALLLTTLRRLRHIQAARRRPGTTVDTPDVAAAEFEREIRAIATDGEDARYIAATNCYLAHQLEAHMGWPLPAVIAARAGAHGVELLLEEACPPVEGFVSGNDVSTTWQLRPDVTAQMMEADAGDAHPYAPGLLVVGGTDAGDLLVDFEQLCATSVEGDPESVLGFQRGLLAAAIAGPWAPQNEIVAIGIDGLEPHNSDLITQPEDPDSWAQEISAIFQSAADQADRSPYEERVDHGWSLFRRSLSSALTHHSTESLKSLAPVAELPTPISR